MNLEVHYTRTCDQCGFVVSGASKKETSELMEDHRNESNDANQTDATYCEGSTLDFEVLVHWTNRGNFHNAGRGSKRMRDITDDFLRIIKEMSK